MWKPNSNSNHFRTTSYPSSNSWRPTKHSRKNLEVSNLFLFYLFIFFLFQHQVYTYIAFTCVHDITRESMANIPNILFIYNKNYHISIWRTISNHCTKMNMFSLYKTNRSTTQHWEDPLSCGGDTAVVSSECRAICAILFDNHAHALGAGAE